MEGERDERDSLVAILVWATESGVSQGKEGKEGKGRQLLNVKLSSFPNNGCDESLLPESTG